MDSVKFFSLSYALEPNFPFTRSDFIAEGANLITDVSHIIIFHWHRKYRVNHTPTKAL